MPLRDADLHFVDDENRTAPQPAPFHIGHSFFTLADACAARDKEWDPEGVITPSFSGLELGGECGEALNDIKKLERERLGLRGSRSTVDKLAKELADILICVQNVANRYNINLPAATRDKFNETSIANNLLTRLG